MIRFATTIEEGQILQALAALGPLPIWRIAPCVGREARKNDRQHSHRVSSLCLSLESRGLVVRVDAEKPIVWKLA